MSLQNLARHMEAQGRGPDRTLVHMTPKEVQGLQAIAMAHGGSLTINPVTGLPEAGFLDKFLPAIAGFALNAFAPGVGTAVGSMFGLGSAAGTALTVGGISGLASGSLEKGIMAGLGAYGGASVGEGLGNMGQNANTLAAQESAVASGLSDVDRVSAIQAAAKPDIGGGIAAAANAPKDFLKDNKYALAALAAPALMGSQGKEPAALPSSGYIRTMKRDPVTGEIYQESATPTGEFGNRSVGTYGGVARMADGGEVTEPLADLNIDEFKQVAYDTRTDSQKALDYLMGKPGAVNPMLFTSGSSRDPLLPLDYRTRTGGQYVLDSATNTYKWVPDTSSAGLPALGRSLDQSGGGYDQPIDARTAAFFDNETKEQRDERMGKVNDVLSMLAPGALVGRALSGALSSPFVGGVMNAFSPPGSQPNYGVPVDNMGTYAGMPGMSPTSYESGVGNPGESEPSTTSSQSGVGNPGEQGGYTSSDTGVGNPGESGPSGGNTSSDTGAGNPGESGAGEGSTGDSGGSADGGDGGGGGGGDGEARGGLNRSGRYYPPKYAQGGIAALAYGGLGSLGGYSDGGRLLRGPGNGTSDSIPATIGNKRPARLADGEFVIPSRIVSELGNGSTEAGARQLYAMMDRIQAARRKTVGKDKVAFDAKARKHLPA